MCGAPEQTAELPPGTDLSKESVLVGRVTAGGSPVATRKRTLPSSMAQKSWSPVCLGMAALTATTYAPCSPAWGSAVMA